MSRARKPQGTDAACTVERHDVEVSGWAALHPHWPSSISCEQKLMRVLIIRSRWLRVSCSDNVRCRTCNVIGGIFGYWGSMNTIVRRNDSKENASATLTCPI